VRTVTVTVQLVTDVYVGMDVCIGYDECRQDVVIDWQDGWLCIVRVLLLTYARVQFAGHWLFWQDDIGLFNGENPRYVRSIVVTLRSLFVVLPFGF
jgi:hypothetical protein